MIIFDKSSCIDIFPKNTNKYDDVRPDTCCSCRNRNAEEFENWHRGETKVDITKRYSDTLAIPGLSPKIFK